MKKFVIVTENKEYSNNCNMAFVRGLNYTENYQEADLFSSFDEAKKKVDIDNDEFVLSTDFLTKVFPSTGANFETEEEAKSRVKERFVITTEDDVGVSNFTKSNKYDSFKIARNEFIDHEKNKKIILSTTLLAKASKASKNSKVKHRGQR